MALTFYPYSEDAQKGTIDERIDTLMGAAERYKAIVTAVKAESTEEEKPRRIAPRDLTAAYNWEEIARILREIREMPEGSKADKTRKGELLRRLAEVYEVLRAAKMSKLEAVRLALVGEANQLQGGASQVA